MWYIDKIKSIMTEEDKRFLKAIYEPTVVGVPPKDARRDMCVLPTGEIRVYGLMDEEKGVGIEIKSTYISSYDGGLSWKKHETEDNIMGSCIYLPEQKRYVTVLVNFDTKNTEARISEIGPDDTEYKRIILAEGRKHLDVFQPKLIKDGTRLIVSCSGSINEHGRYPVCFLSDDFGDSWETVNLKPTPIYEPIYPSIDFRWENSGAEPSVTELPDGRLMMLARTSHDCYYAYYSSDYGETWTDPEPSKFHATLTTPFLHELPDGRKMLFWNNTQPLPEDNHANELHGAGGYFKGENQFTNRDIAHCAISNDGVNWEGFREVMLQERRNCPDYRIKGRTSIDRSVQQFQAINLPFNKVLVAMGQNEEYRKLVIFDVDWLYEKEQKENFCEGLAKLSTHMYVKSYSGCYGKHGHCQWNRTNGALLMPSPDMDGSEVLQICRVHDERLYSEKQGVVWNFPMAAAGQVDIEFQIQGAGIYIALCDHWFNPVDNTVQEMSPYSFKLTSDTVTPNEWHKISIKFEADSEFAEVFIDEVKKFKVRKKFSPNYGISYLHMQTLAEQEDFKGTLIKSLEMLCLC